MNRQYPPRNNRYRSFRRVFLFLLLLLCCGCERIRDFYRGDQPESVRFTVNTAEMRYEASLPGDLTVAQALERINVPYSETDRIEPSLSSLIRNDPNITIVHISWDEQTAEKIIPFESQTILNESLPAGETRLLQSGRNGKQEVMTRFTYEDGVLVSQTVSRSRILEEAVPEILMYGAKAESVSVRIPGRIIYVSAGNIWMMENSTNNRTPLFTGGDADGRILDLNDSGKWLMFSRSGRDSEVNTLWMLNIADWNAEPISLRVSNIIRFARWLPGDTLRFVYSTVEPVDEAPGWKAKNDLMLQMVSDTGMLMLNEEVMPAAAEDGSYSWWGSDYLLSDAGRFLYEAGPDAVSEIDRLNGEKRRLVSVRPYNSSRSDWAWTPGLTVSPEGDNIIFGCHDGADISQSRAESNDFGICRYNKPENTAEVLIKNSGLFSFPAFSPRFTSGKAYIVYFQNRQQTQVEGERYQLRMMEEDGENDRAVYPSEISGGYITPRQPVWAPVTTEASARVAFLQDGSLLLVNPFNGVANEIRTDSPIDAFIWE